MLKKVKFGLRRRNALVLCGLLLFGLLAAGKGSANVLRYIVPSGGDAHVDIHWKTIGSSPQAARKYTPQGMTSINGAMVMAVSWDDTKTVLYVFHADEGEYQIINQLEMPAEAVHTSGLAWDGSFLWAVDYVSHRIYKIDWQASLDAGAVQVLESCPTGLKGSGSLARLQLQGEEVVAISDFMHTGRTYFVPVATIFDEGDIPSKSIASYKNAFFVQGLTAQGGFLYETSNCLGQDLIYKIDPLQAIEADDYSEAIVARYSGPSKMIEDLAFDGERWWTSD